MNPHEDFLGELWELARELNDERPDGTPPHPADRAVGEAALNLLRHQLAEASEPVLEALRQHVRETRQAALAERPYLDPVVEALCEMVLRDPPPAQ